MTKRQIAEQALAKVSPEYEAFREKLGFDRELFSAPLCACEPAALEADYAYRPATDIRRGLRKFAEWYAAYRK